MTTGTSRTARPASGTTARRRSLALALAVGALAGATHARPAAAVGEQTASYGTAGVATVDGGNATSSRVVDAAGAQTAGRFVALLGRGVVARLDATGTLDATFGSSSFARVGDSTHVLLDGDPDAAAGGTTDVARVLVGASDVLTIVGPAGDPTAPRGTPRTGIGIGRLTAAGAAATGFGTAGFTFLTAAQAAGATPLADAVVTTDGAVLLAFGDATATTSTVLRLTSAGVLDTGFDGDGRLTVDGSAPTLATAPSGTAYVRTADASGTRLRRLVAAGADATFAAGTGVRSYPVGCALVPRATASLLVDCGTVVRKADLDGFTDASYGGTGTAPLNQDERVVGADDAGRAVVLRPSDTAVRRLAADGSVDSGYTPSVPYGSRGLVAPAGDLYALHGTTGQAAEPIQRVRRILPTGTVAPYGGTTGGTDATDNSAGARFGFDVDTLDSEPRLLPGPSGTTWVVTVRRETTGAPATEAFLSRLTSAGKPDAAVTPTSIGDPVDVTADATGRVLVLGADGITRRYGANGTADGFAATTYSRPSGSKGIALVAAGTETYALFTAGTGAPADASPRLFGFDANGSLLGGFPANGVALPRPSTATYPDAEPVAMKASGTDRLLVAWDSADSGDPTDRGTVLQRATLAGATDTTYGTQGFATIADNAPSATALATSGLDVRADGSALVVIDQLSPSGATARLVRTTASGAVDTTFGSGSASIALSPTGRRSTAALAADGSVLAIAPNAAGSRITRFTPTGAVDATFAPPAALTTELRDAGGAAILQLGETVLVADAARTYPAASVGANEDVLVRSLDLALSKVLSATSTQQYTLTGSNGTTWQKLDAVRLSLPVNPTSASTAVLTGNADLWTWDAGFNQDLALFVDDQLVAWKESGGFAGTFSPNAATVVAAVPLAAGSHTVDLRWKTNKADPGGKISAGAGPINGAYSPTRITATLVPNASPTTVVQAASTQQYTLTGSNGTTWQKVDPTRLTMTVSPTKPVTAALTANADLWTWNAGFNQDLAIFVDDQLAAWKESGGFAGTFSPNAATIATTVPLTAGTHTIDLRWKTNKANPGGKISAGAGPIGQAFSPTRIVASLVPTTASATTTRSVVSTKQHTLTGSNGTAWQKVDASLLTTTVTPDRPVVALLTANADLWTWDAGFNQDLAIFVDDQLVAWKESGGFAGTFSPNAATIVATLPLAPGSHTIDLRWKTNKADAGKISAGAGPIGQAFSPTTLTITQVPS